MTFLDLQLDRPTWERMHATPERLGGVLGRTWTRASEAGADPHGPRDLPMLTDGRLQHRRDRLGPVLALLDDVLGPTEGIFHGLDFSLLFADAEGLILDRRAGGAFDAEARRVHLGPGSAWDEANRGTNAIGTAIAERVPVAVRGCAHFAAPNHGLACYAAPVHDPWGELVGVLDATSYAERANPLAGVAVISAARALEEALRISSLAAPGSAFLERFLGRLRDPALLVSPRGRVTHVNGAAAQALPDLGRLYRLDEDLLRTRVPVEQALGRTLDEIRAAGAGQVRLSGVRVEPIEGRDGRTAAWLVVLVSPAPPRRRDALVDVSAFEDLVGDDPTVRGVRTRAARVAPSDLPVLILGETGTGKELLARGLHAASHRADQPFVPVNCAALTPSLLQSELFGYAGGAFTDADPRGRSGRLATAHGGTLFLDEIAEMPLALQALLLRVLEDGVYHRVGEDTPRSVDVRLVCATCRDLPALVEEGAFRADLFYRVRGASLTLPPVREREDLDLLCTALLGSLARAQGRPAPTLSRDALAVLQGWAWPGNVRELRMALHHALVVARDDDTLEPWHLPDMLAGTPTRATARTEAPSAPSLAEARLQAVRKALQRYGGNVSAAARSLGVARSTVYRLMKRHGIAGEE